MLLKLMTLSDLSIKAYGNKKLFISLKNSDLIYQQANMKLTVNFP